MKPCNTCKVDKPATREHFPIDKRIRSGLGGQCKECRSLKIGKWQARNYNRVLAASRRWKGRNPDKVKVYSKRYWAENKEVEYARVRTYMRAGGGKRESYYNRLRRDRKRGAKGDCSFEQLQARIDFYGGLCYLCGGEADTIDHVIPLARGGTEWPSNLRPACHSCNSSKGANAPSSGWPLPKPVEGVFSSLKANGGGKDAGQGDHARLQRDDRRAEGGVSRTKAGEHGDC